MQIHSRTALAGERSKASLYFSLLLARTAGWLGG